MNLKMEKEFADPFRPDLLEKKMNWKPLEDMEVFYRMLPGADEGQEIKVKVYRPKNAKAPLPVIMNVHGGAFVAGSCDNDDTRMENLVRMVPAIVVSVDYRLVPQYVFPAALMDCYSVWNWLSAHASEIGGDANSMALYGTSAGGNLCAGLAFYIRDNGGTVPALNVLNVPALSLGPSVSQEQMRYDSLIVSGEMLAITLRNYLGGLKGERPSYYAVPNLALDFSDLPPTFLILAGCDPLRDEGLEYMHHLLNDAIPVEVHMIPGAYHGFNSNQTPTVKVVEEAVILAYQREFEKKEEDN